MPFLWSLERNRDFFLARLAHGATFGALLAALCLPRWPALWAAFGLLAAIVAAAAGPVLRARSGWAALAGVPVLWTGIEVLRDTAGMFGTPRFAGWLSLGHAVAPGLPEAEIASVVGVHGLSFLLALGNTAFLLVLRARTGARQILIAAAATAVPLALHGAGRVLAPPDPPPAGIATVVAAQTRRDAGNLVHLTDRLAAARPRLIVWPGAPLVRIPAGSRSLLVASGEAGDLGVRLGAAIVLGIEEDIPGAGEAWTGIAVVDPDGRIAGKRATTAAGEPADRDDGARIFPLLGGKFGLAIGSELATPALARWLTGEGAGLLVLAAGHGDAWSRVAVRLHERMVLFRAIENRRFVAKSGRHGAFIADPRGRKLASVAPGLEGAAVEEAAMLDTRSLYARGGWMIEPFCLGCAIGIIALGAARSVRKRAPRLSARSPACPPGEPRAPFRT